MCNQYQFVKIKVTMFYIIQFHLSEVINIENVILSCILAIESTSKMIQLSFYSILLQESD